MEACKLGKPEWAARPSEEAVDPRIQTHKTTEKTGRKPENFNELELFKVIIEIKFFACL